jgi:hypothetical protein
MTRRFFPIVLLSLLVIAFTVAILDGNNSFNIVGNQTLPPSRFFVDDQCKIACWEGLRPGTTTLDHVNDFFGQRFPGDFSTRNYPNAYTLYVAEYEARRTINAVVSQDVLAYIELSGFTDLTLGDIVRELNNPEYISLRYNISPAGTLSSYLDIFYPEQGFTFSFSAVSGMRIERTSDSNVDICLEENAFIIQANVVIPGSIESVLATTSRPSNPLSDEVINSIINQLGSWPGFTCVDFPYPPR